MIAQDVNVGALSGEARARWGFTLQMVMPSGDEVQVDVATRYGTSTWDTRAEAERAADATPPRFDAAAARARADAARYAALNARMRGLMAALRADDPASRDGAHAATDAAGAMATLAGLFGVNDGAAAPVALAEACESPVSVSERPGRIVLVFDEARPWSVRVSLWWPGDSGRWRRDIERADARTAEARVRHEEER